MANGQVTTGFSKPYVAKYTEENGAVVYTDGMPLARGVDVNVEPESSENNNFYADNQVAESDSGKFTGGTVTLTVDGLKTAAERLVMGVPAAGEDGWTDYDDDQSIPDVGIGFIRRVMEGGRTYYIPYVLVRCTFAQIPISAATQEEEIDWQTEEVSATIKRAGVGKHKWRSIGERQDTESAADEALRTKLGITDSGSDSETETETETETGNG